MSRPSVRESSLHVKLKNDTVQCILCERRCIIDTEQIGVCKTRKNIGGRLFTLVYGDVSAIESRPIEIKPFFHYWPGSTALTFSTWSCNFDCPWCQNHSLSRAEPVPERSESISPARIVELAVDSGDEGLCGSFQEPTLLTDWAMDVFPSAKARALYCCYVSNGYMTTEALELLRRSGLDGLKIDVKGDEETYRKYCGSVQADVPWRNAETAKKMGIHVEIVNLIIPGVNDSESTIATVVEEHLRHLGPDTPMHFTRYVPAYKFHAPATDVQRLEYARETARKSGIKYAYIGNVRDHPYENTFCPECNERVIARDGYAIASYRLTRENRCPTCGTGIPITGHCVKKHK
jgi:pyruvate formate lyase activating enzyme